MNKANFGQPKKIFILLAAAIFLTIATAKISARQTVDKTVAIIRDNVSKPELITYSDLLWNLAMQPGVPLNPPRSEDLNRMLQLLINQRVFALEAQRLPLNPPNEDDIKKEIERVIREFPSVAEFEQRLRTVGFESVRDENFRRMMVRRVAIEKYLDFRFRSFVIVTTENENRYYREVYVPEFRRGNPGLIVPPLESVRSRINAALIEREVEQDIEDFLDQAKDRAEIEILFEV